ncbi:hypothetical protein [Acinetobacter bereziniae]|uniref:hypothetical protein n=1 Tax=Acinetobacter bereziniae TaxID=106648 RepID=UPI0012F947D5|nr:hypothetical protein [Acinetobacter bereziniae]
MAITVLNIYGDHLNISLLIDWHYLPSAHSAAAQILVPESFIDLFKNNRLIEIIKKHDWHNITQ